MVDMTNDVIRFEEMFANRFTESDKLFMELKSKPQSQPAVIYPWKISRKQWNKKWDYSSHRNSDERDYKDRSRHRSENRSSHNRHRDRSGDNEGFRDRHRDRSSERSDSRHKNQDNCQSQSRGRPDFQSTYKAYQQR